MEVGILGNFKKVTSAKGLYLENFSTLFKLRKFNSYSENGMMHWVFLFMQHPCKGTYNCLAVAGISDLSPRKEVSGSSRKDFQLYVLFCLIVSAVIVGTV